MKKIAILTLYNNNNNYGGLAQAYALWKYLSNNGFETEIIDYKMQRGITGTLNDRLNAQVHSNGLKAIFEKGHYIFTKIIGKKVASRNRKKLLIYSADLSKRKARFQEFRDIIPHSREFTADTICQSVNDYDIFISGSDQIWKPGVIQDAFVLKFVPEGKRKISYATSIAVSNIQRREWFCRYLEENLSSYNALSVREESSAKELQDVLRRDVSCVVDPTLLLDKQEWENLASERLVDEKYLFAYLLGKSKKQRDFIKDYAKEKGLTIVSIPFAGGEYVEDDTDFGEYRLFEVGIPEFFSLIKYAEVVFTDSFHAVCFSRVFQRNFYVMERKVESSVDKMNSRIESILKIMDLQDRMIDVETCSRLHGEIDYENVEKCLVPYIAYSKEYIKKAMLG